MFYLSTLFLKLQMSDYVCVIQVATLYKHKDMLKHIQPQRSSLYALFCAELILTMLQS